MRKNEEHYPGVYDSFNACGVDDFVGQKLTKWNDELIVRTPTQCHIDLACNTPYHFAASRTASPRVSPYLCPGPFAPFGSRI